MDDLQYGVRDKRGQCRPTAPLEIAPFRIGRVDKLGRWFIGYLRPRNTLFLAAALAYWFLVPPEAATMRKISRGWAPKLCVVNAVGIFALYGAVESFYYLRRKQQTRFKYNAAFPSDQPSDVFWFKSQNPDNFLRTYLFLVSIWTLIEVFTLWRFANDYANAVDVKTHWIWLAALILLAPAIHEIHFFCGRWLIHQGPLYKWIHSIHHNAINPRPGLAVIFITHQAMPATAVGDHFAVLIRGAVAADFRRGEKTREEITNPTAGGETMAALEAEVEGDARHRLAVE